MGEGIGKKVIKKIYGLDRSCFFIENCVLRYVEINVLCNVSKVNY